VSDSPQRSSQQSIGRLTRRVAASFYFYSPLPALIRCVRDRYQVEVRSNTYFPRVSWSKRTEPCARILCYHRVNEDRDPFFPAISPRLFEQEMRFVAQRYKVVTLGELLSSLNGTLPQAVLAITFDDGYKDNYENAFPVLRRYDLPATIFLTTGALDSREPLWFEQLAQALKKTRCEFIDLEIGTPRRCWLRTPSERLDSNNLMFRLLRELQDSERRQRLAQILNQLDVADHSETRDRMLTWDQIRFMKTNGIDFGGHTVTHPFLSQTTPEQAAWEVSECKRRIEEELQEPVKYFAYPNGRKEDFTNWNKKLIQEAGYHAAVTTIWGMNYRSTDRMELRRGGPWEESPELFASKLDWYQLANA
jgi:peptidoglycan/xylan/chitin deacetylase (PgdA/CDA1 family)